MGSCFSLEGRTPVPGSPTSAASGFQRKKTSKKTNYWRDEALHKVPGRFYSNESTEIASLFTQQGKKGTNQDAMIVWENFSSRKDTVFCGVFDGHGPYGHLVAKRVRDSLPLKLSAHWKVVVNGEDIGKEVNTKATTSLVSEETPLVSAADNESPKASVLTREEAKNPPEIFGLLKESFLKAFKVMDRELRMHPSIDCFCSGTTAVTLIKQGKYIVLGNVGDSRAVLGTRDEKGSLVAVQLTIDLKPNLPEESERIRKCKGRVFALQGEPDVARVWLPNNMSPGLAMARAFGDFCLKDYGLISVPDISCRSLSDKDEFVVLATDGVWDVLTNKEVVDIVSSAPTRSSAARALVESAVRAWRYKYPTSKVDDCAVVCLFLDSNDLYTASSEPKLKETNDQLDSSVGGTTTTTTDTVSKKSIADESAEEEGDEEEEEEEEEDADVVDSQEKDWSALEGVSRANTLLDLPRF